MNQNYDPTQQQSGNQWSSPTGNPPQPYSGGSLSPNQMTYALWADRVLAALIDGGVALAFMIVLYIVIFLFFGALTLGSGAIGGEAGGLLGSLGCCGGFLLIIVLPPVSYLVIGLLNKVYWVSTRGYSIGQGVMKLKVVDKAGNLIPMGTSVLRLAVTVGLGFIPLVGGLLDLLFPLFDDPTRQTLHDKAVGTYVIKTQ
jgi:uncharacterized RDD family membrane protein YckC